MSDKSLYFFGATVGGLIGAYIPALWGDTGLLSVWSIIMSTVGGLTGIWAVHKFIAG